MSDTNKLLYVYLQDHLAGAAGGSALVERTWRAERGTELEQPLSELRRDIEHDRGRLLEVTAALGAPRRAALKTAVSWLAEKLGRAKLNRRLFARSPLSRVLELEGLQMGVTGKRALWQTLLQLRPIEPKLSGFELDELLRRADDQLATIAALHDRVVRGAFVTHKKSAALPAGRAAVAKA
jgi:hypothetical protein